MSKPLQIIIKRKIDGPSTPELGTPTSNAFDSITVPLTRPSTGPNAITSYTIERATSSSGPWTVAATGALIFGNPPTAYTDGGRVALTTYYYRARATDSANRVSGYSATVSGMTQPASTTFSPNFPRLAAGYLGPATWGNAAVRSKLGKYCNVTFTHYNGAQGAAGISLRNAMADIRAQKPAGMGATQCLAAYIVNNEVPKGAGAEDRIRNECAARQWFLYDGAVGGTIKDSSYGEGGYYAINNTSYQPRVSGKTWNEWYADLMLVQNVTGEPGNDANDQINGLFLDNVMWSPRTGTANYTHSGGNEAVDATIEAAQRQGLKDFFDYLRAVKPAQLTHVVANIDDLTGAEGGNIYSANFTPNLALIAPLSGVIDGGLGEYLLGHPAAKEQQEANSGATSWNVFRNQVRFLDACVRNPALNWYSSYEITTADTSTNWRNLRFALCAYTVIGNGGFNDGLTSQTSFFPDEYDNAGAGIGYLGQAIDPPQYAPTQNGCYRRRFANGEVWVNPRNNGAQTITVGAGLKRIAGRSGRSDTSVNSGAAATTVTLQDRDGIILIKGADTSLVAGSAPTLTASAGDGVMNLTINALPVAGRTVVDYEIQRLINGTWTTLSLAHPRAASELPPPSTKAPTKWVSPSGTLAGNSAYTTIQAAVNASVPGDEIVVGPGTYTEKVLFTTSGTAANPIRLRCYDYNNKPTIDATGLDTTWQYSDLGSASIVSIAASHIIWDGINIENVGFNGSVPTGCAFRMGDCRNNSAFIYEGEANTWFYGIRLYRSKMSNVSGGAIGMFQTDDWTIGGCDFACCMKGTYWEPSAGNAEGWGAAVGLQGRNGQFIENTVRQAMGEGVHIGNHQPTVAGSAVPLAYGAQNVVIRNNIIYDCWSQPIYIAVGDGLLIERNLVFMSNDSRFWYGRNPAGDPRYGICFGTELGRPGNPTAVIHQSWVGVQNVVLRNNIMNGARSLFAFIGYGVDNIDGYRNVDVEHNTIFRPQGGNQPIWEVINNGAPSRTYTMTNVRFRNNVALCANAADLCDLWEPLGAGKAIGGNVFSHAPPADLVDPTNIVNSGPTVLTDKTYVTTSSGYPNVVPFNLLQATPYLSGPTVSPAVNAIASIGAAVDYYGLPRPTHTGKVDAGAISLSLPLTITYTETGLPPGFTASYRVRYRQSDGALSAFSA